MKIQLYNSNSDIVGNVSTLDSASVNKYVSQRVTSGQTYYIKVMLFDPNDKGGTFQITFNTSSTPPLPNDSKYAAELTDNKWSELFYATLSSDGWFKFIATATTQYIHVNYSRPAGLSVQLYNPNGSKAGNQANLNDSVKYISQTLTIGQTYYIKITLSDPNDFYGTYRLAINSTFCSPDVVVNPLTADIWKDGDIPTSNGENWFKFTATDSSQYIHVIFDKLTRLSIQLYDSSGSPVGASAILPDNITGLAYIQRPVTSEKEYYIKITPASSEYGGTYKITFNTSATAPS